MADWDPDDTTPWIASVGHSDHDFSDFLVLLRAHGIGTLLDVRSFPKSHHSQYSRDRLAPALQDAGFVYHHLPGVGGKRDIAYREAMKTEAWQKAYAHLKDLALAAQHAGRPAAFMCVERDPADCHRRHIGRALEADGWRVRHILPDTGQTRLF